MCGHVILCRPCASVNILLSHAFPFLHALLLISALLPFPLSSKELLTLLVYFYFMYLAVASEIETYRDHWMPMPLPGRARSSLSLSLEDNIGNHIEYHTKDHMEHHIEEYHIAWRMP